jgi:hypothetical protein
VAGIVGWAGIKSGWLGCGPSVLNPRPDQYRADGAYKRRTAGDVVAGGCRSLKPARTAHAADEALAAIHETDYGQLVCNGRGARERTTLLPGARSNRSSPATFFLVSLMRVGPQCDGI